MTRILLLVQRWIAGAFAAWLESQRGTLTRLLGAVLAENARQGAELELLRSRLGRLPSRKRPRYKPQERLDILAHRERWKLSLDETARLFVLSAGTLTRWIQDVERGVAHLVTTREPMNKLPDLVREVAHLLRHELPRWGSRRVAAVLAALGLKASRTSVQRMLKKRPPRRPAAVAPRTRLRSARPVQPKEPGDVWLVDFTEVRAFMGFVTITIGAVVDAFSRKVVAIAAWRGRPVERTAADAILLVRRAIDAARAPRWIVSDHGRQFIARRFGAFLARRKVRRRFGAVGRPQAVAIVDRFFRSVKSEIADAFFALKPLATINRQLAGYAAWFNERRVHLGLGGRTPNAVHAGRPPRKLRRLEPGGRYALSVRYVNDTKRLPVFRLRAA
jgi:transposase InsO family protein